MIRLRLLKKTLDNYNPDVHRCNKENDRTGGGPTLDALNSLTSIRRESSDSINRDRAPVLNLQYSTMHTDKNTFSDSSKGNTFSILLLTI